MHKVHFSTGGYVIHGITSPDFVGKVSAWFNADGLIIDAEQYRNYHPRPVKPNGPIWRYCQSVAHWCFAD